MKSPIERISIMKKLLFIIIPLFITAGVAAQNIRDPQFAAQIAARLELSEAETERLLQIYTETEMVIREADLELDIYKARLARLLFSSEVDMAEVERLLRQSYEWQLKRQLAQIRRQVEIRKLLGDERWARYSRLVRTLLERAEDQRSPSGQSD
jgi:hypothetical protein